MTLLYKPSKIRSHLDPEQKERYIARPTKRIIVDQDAIGELLAMRSTVSPEDVSLVLNGLRHVMMDLLGDNHIIHLPGFGIFGTAFKSEVADTPDGITYRSVKDIKLTFRPDPWMKRKMKEFVVRKG
ncbi:MAG: hypothetical protein KDC05_12130 [Bacteroidales bacterium]|nr:hypothetical protein [Bacteroidales bacterium]